MTAVVDASFGTLYELSEKDEVLFPTFLNSIRRGMVVAFKDGPPRLRSPVTEWK